MSNNTDLGKFLPLNNGSIITLSGASQTFTGLPAGIRRITVGLRGFSSNGTSDFLIRLGTSGGLVSTGYLGYSGLVGPGGTATANYTTGFGINQNVQGTALVGHGLMTIMCADLTNNIWVASGVVAYSDSARGCIFGGSVALSGACDRLAITTVNGTDTFDAGSINILYE